MKFLVTELDRQICLIADNIILEDDGVYYAWNDATPHKVQRANSTDTLEIVDVPEGTQLPNDQFVIGKYVYTVDGTFVVWEHWVEDEEE